MRCSVAFAVLFLVCTQLPLCEARKNRRRRKKKNGRAKAAPEDPRFLCHGCEAVIIALGETIRPWGRTDYARIVEKVHDVCQRENFLRFDYPPPKMLRACQTVVDGNDELIENTFAENPDMLLSDIAKFICLEKTGFCEGVEANDPIKPTVKNYGKPQPGSDDDDDEDEDPNFQYGSSLRREKPTRVADQNWITYAEPPLDADHPPATHQEL